MVPTAQIVVTIRRVSIENLIDEADNVRDHRAGTSDHPFQKHAQVRLRVHHIVISRFRRSLSASIFLPDFNMQSVWISDHHVCVIKVDNLHATVF